MTNTTVALAERVTMDSSASVRHVSSTVWVSASAPANTTEQIKNHTAQAHGSHGVALLEGKLCCAGGTSWEARAPLSSITGAGRCEFVHNLMYCFGGSLGAGMPTVNTLNVSAYGLSFY